LSLLRLRKCLVAVSEAYNSLAFKAGWQNVRIFWGHISSVGDKDIQFCEVLKHYGFEEYLLLTEN